MLKLPHQITHSTSIKYDAVNATFKTPLGVLTPAAVAEARGILNQIETENGAVAQRHRREVRHALVVAYYRLVPSDFGFRIPTSESLLNDNAKIQKQCAILEALEAAFNSAAPKSIADKLFSCKLTLLSKDNAADRAEFDRIKKLYSSSINRHHATAALKLTRVYKVEIESMKKDFDQTAAKLGNVRQDQWHGTKASNLLSILKSGLQIPNSGAAHCSGRMFGNGVYSSTQSTKALNYATGFWNGSGARNQRTFMFLTEVALGKMHTPKMRSGSFPKPGTNSTWVEAGTCGVMNQETIVYQTSQINLKYLCEFGAA